MIYPRTCTIRGGAGHLMSWLASLALDDEVRQDLGLLRVVCEY